MIYYTIVYYAMWAIMAIGALFCAWQIVAADMRRRIIPDVFLFPLLIIGLVMSAYFPFPISIEAAIIGAAFGYAMSAIVGYLFERHGKSRADEFPPIGFGDIKLIAVGGIWLGITGLATALAMACIGGGIWSRRNKQKYIPFAPFFIGGGILTFIGMLFLL